MASGQAKMFKIFLKIIALASAMMVGAHGAAHALGQANLDTQNDPSNAIRRVIEQQLNAIRRDDAERAFALAAPNIRRAFRDATTFMALISKDYQPITRWTAATFLDLRTFENHYIQRVKLVDKTGAVSVANYALIKADTGTGEWWVAGVAIEDKAADAKPTN